MELVRSIWVRFANSNSIDESVLEADGLENRPELVIAVGTLVQNAQIEVQFGERRDGNLHDSVLQQGENIVRRANFWRPLQKCKLYYKSEPDDFASEQLDEPGDRRGGSAGGEDVVDDQDVLAGFDGVGVDLELIGSVFQLILDAPHDGREFLGLANRDETRAERVSHGGGEEVAAGFDADHDIDGSVAIVLLKRVDGLRESRACPSEAW